MPKADEFFGMGKLMEQCPALRGVIVGTTITAMLVWGCVYLGDGQSDTDWMTAWGNVAACDYTAETISVSFANVPDREVVVDIRDGGNLSHRLVLTIYSDGSYYSEFVPTRYELEHELSTLDLESYTLAELVHLVGPGWGYDVSRDGIVTLADGEVDLGESSSPDFPMDGSQLSV